MNTSTPTIIFSVHRAESSAAENRRRHTYIKALLRIRNIAFFDATGCYKGRRENSFVLLDVAHNIETVRFIAKAFDQESILRIDANRQARLETVDGDLIGSLGTFREIHPVIAKQQDAWTECNGRYWVAA